MNIVITGASGGLGHALKQKFMERGDTVFDLSRTAEGENCLKCDVANRENVFACSEIIKNKCTHIDMLINNAGIALSGATELLPESEIKKIIDVNVLGVINCTQAFLPLMKKGGKIVNISSPCGDFPLPFRTMYCVTKSAVSMFSYCTRLELKQAGIQVSAMCPGNIFTNLSKNRVKITTTNEKYGDSIKTATDKINKEANNRMSLEYVSGVIFKKILKKKLKPRYVIGKKYKFLYFLQRLVPQKLLFWGVEKFSK